MLPTAVLTGSVSMRTGRWSRSRVLAGVFAAWCLLPALLVWVAVVEAPLAPLLTLTAVGLR